MSWRGGEGAGELGEIFTSSDSERAWCGDGEKFRHCFSYITGGRGGEGCGSEEIFSRL